MKLPLHIDLVGLILAGGNSTRMGTDKAQLSIEGHSMLDRTKALLKAVGAETILISRNRAGYLADKYKNAGPVSGIYTALEHLLASRKRKQPQNTLQALLIMPIDMPLLDQSLLSELVLCGAEMHTALCFKEHPLPLFLPVCEEALECAKIVVESEHRSVKRFVSILRCSSITTKEQLKFINTNDPVQWEFAVERLTNTGLS
ncbi:molybdenum cofactor guanylyltransferase [Thalassotalea ganghwensis]